MEFTAAFTHQLIQIMKNKYKGQFDDDIFMDTVERCLTTDKYTYTTDKEKIGFFMRVYHNLWLDELRRLKHRAKVAEQTIRLAQPLILGDVPSYDPLTSEYDPELWNELEQD